MALRPRLWPGVPLSWDVLGQRYVMVRYKGRQVGPVKGRPEVTRLLPQHPPAVPAAFLPPFSQLEHPILAPN